MQDSYQSAFCISIQAREKSPLNMSRDKFILNFSLHLVIWVELAAFAKVIFVSIKVFIKIIPLSAVLKLFLVDWFDVIFT